MVTMGTALLSSCLGAERINGKADVNLCQYVTEAASSSLFMEGSMGHAVDSLFDGKFETPWGLNASTGWVEFTLDEPRNVQRVVIDEGLLNRITGHTFKARLPNGQWKELFQGKGIGYRRETEFEPITARTFRLEITDTISTPGLWQIELYDSPAERIGHPRGMAPPESVKKLRELGLGAWIIWGPQSLSELEISFCRGNQIPVDVYDRYHQSFDPPHYDPESWIRILKNAGFKYVVYVPKHHDGFCLWDTKTTDHNIMNSPFGRDIVKDLVAACKKERMEFCLYYSIGDSYNPDCKTCRKFGESFGAKGSELPNGQEPDFDRYVGYMKTHLKELSDISGDCLMWWFDANWNSNWTPERARDLYRYMRKLQPKALFSNRIGSPFAGDHYEVTWFATEKSFGDYAVMEFHIPPFRRDAPWEYTQTSSDTYSYSKTPIKSAAAQIFLLANTVCRDGNFLLASSILTDGSFDRRLMKEFETLGKWLSKYGESIYETRGGPFMPSAYYASSCRDNTVYVHIFRMNDGRVMLPALGKKIIGIERLGGGKVECEHTPQSITIRIPPAEFRSVIVDTATGYGNLPVANHVLSLDTIVKLKLDGNAFEIAPIAAGAAEPVKPVQASGNLEDMLSNPK